MTARRSAHRRTRGSIVACPRAAERRPGPLPHSAVPDPDPAEVTTPQHPALSA